MLFLFGEIRYQPVRDLTYLIFSSKIDSVFHPYQRVFLSDDMCSRQNPLIASSFASRLQSSCVLKGLALTTYLTRKLRRGDGSRGVGEEGVENSESTCKEAYHLYRSETSFAYTYRPLHGCSQRTSKPSSRHSTASRTRLGQKCALSARTKAFERY